MNPEKIFLELGLTLILGQEKDFGNFPHLFHEVIWQVDSYLPVRFIEILLIRRATAYCDTMIYLRVMSISFDLALSNKEGIFVPAFGIADLAGKYFGIIEGFIFVLGKQHPCYDPAYQKV